MTTTDKFPSLEGGVAELGAGHDALPGLHEVDVPPEGVDLSVVSDEPHGMSSLPAGEGVGAEPGVDDAEMGLHVGLGEVQVVLPELAGVELSLVDNGPAGERTDVEPHSRLWYGVASDLQQTVS